ncbi:MAG: hypothetical protein HON98_13830 [Chloroflexi bacterium]|jgi:signal transduction histidine kinase|nr:hypothetical protein [Chloroflexota bacterium]MBT4001933.1 hypothetical protein [Chloroflexota bacterium]MBT4305630.1 hypothetical protein [Chloroflexota bacterium]MBT4535018.1 hypothetical protein [Chloroflexota bacterium]MBT4756748.1 hypothetical protein [Chloroflexota bacterium]
MKSFINKKILTSIPWLILLYLLYFTYSYFFVIPYFDFHIESQQEIVALYVDESDLKISDSVIELNGLTTENFNQDLLLYRYKNIEIGKSFSLTVQRGYEQIVTHQTSKNFSQEEFIARLGSQWWFSYIFWIAGLITYLNIRPRNTLWRLLTTFFFLISIWMMASSGFSFRHYLGGAIILRVGMLLTVPVIIHLHWIYPIPMNNSNKTPVWIISSYVVGILVSILQIFQLVPAGLYAILFLISLIISFVLILVRIFKYKEQRKSYSVIALFTFFAILPGILVSIANAFEIIIPYPLGGLTALAFPLIPLAYFYSINRQNLGKLEFRVNKLIILYLFAILLGSVLIFLLPLVSQFYSISENGSLLAISSSLIFSIFSILIYIPFQNFIEKRILGIPEKLELMQRSFASELNTTLDHEKFKNLIEEKVSASLLIRQSALIEIEKDQASILYDQEENISKLPTIEELKNLPDFYSRFIQPPDQNHLPKTLAWAKLILPLYFENVLIGIWLFGRRDPDDFYSAYDIEMLQNLADQITISVINHQQSQHLRALYQQNIDRHETERARLARELHDDTLNNLALIKNQSTDSKTIEATESTISHLRKIIQGLRPEMLTYGGLATALEDFGDLLSERQDNVEIITEIHSEPAEIDENIELHIFRIVQQACENSLQHANAKSLVISGEITPKIIQLSVKDDGVGFPGSSVDFRNLLSEKHYGLAGMHERSSLINGTIEIISNPGKGTDVKIYWEN